MAGQKIKLGRGYVIDKDGAIKKRFVPRDASHAIRAKKSKRVRVTRRTGV